MSSCTSCNSAAQAYQSVFQQSIKQQFAGVQKPAAASSNTPDTTGQQPLNSSGRGQLVNISA